MKKKKRILGIAIASIVGVAAIVFAIWNRIVPDYSSTLQRNWQFELPVKALFTEVYENDTGSSFTGDGYRYHVFSYEYEDYIDLMFAWGTIERDTWSYESYSEATDAWLEQIDVPKEFYPDYENCMYWYKNQKDDPRDEIIVFWNSEENEIYIVESFF